jgi:hypothetical protein
VLFTVQLLVNFTGFILFDSSMTVNGIYDRIWNGRGLLKTLESSYRRTQLKASMSIAETRTGVLTDTKQTF